MVGGREYLDCSSESDGEYGKLAKDVFVLALCGSGDKSEVSEGLGESVELDGAGDDGGVGRVNAKSVASIVELNSKSNSAIIAEGCELLG